MYMYNLPYMHSHKYVNMQAHISYTNAREEKETLLVFMALTPFHVLKASKLSFPSWGFWIIHPEGVMLPKLKSLAFRHAGNSKPNKAQARIESVVFQCFVCWVPLSCYLHVHSWPSGPLQ